MRLHYTIVHKPTFVGPQDFMVMSAPLDMHVCTELNTTPDFRTFSLFLLHQKIPTNLPDAGC